MLERALIDHGSPTLANMKVGSLFTSSCTDATGFRAEFRRVQAALESRGVLLTILRVQQERALVYVYRQEALAALLAQADAGRHTRTSAKRCAFSSATRRAARHTRRFSAPDGRLNG